ncbi:MFS transporter [Belnapia rosea]|uniref:MFS transporter n=1 Tax=Belnapia rosea TaxID=938405 RepID=UPI00088E82D3|nr:MFS transporter [Belnapia rosea]SDB72373.1 Predicted arabinose efflux permease, MFS family [Belnapia rosea]
MAFDPITPPPAAEPVTDVRRLILLLGISCFAGAFGGRVLDPFVTTLATEFEAPVREAALLASAYALPFALIQPILGPVGDAVGKRRIIQVGLCCLTLFCLLAPLAPSLGMLLALRALAGAAAGGIMPLTLAAVGDAVPMQGRQVALSRLLVFSIVGQIAGGALAGVLGPLIGWRGLMLVCAGLAAAAAVVMLTVPLSRVPEPRGRFDAVRAIRRYRSILALPQARLLYAAVAIEGVLIFGTFPYFAPMLEARGLGGPLGATAEAGMTVAAFGLGGVVYAMVARPLLARLGQGRMVVLGGALAAVALLGFGLAPGAALFIASGLALGTGFYMLHNSIQTRVTELAPEARGSAVALHAFHFFTGQSLGPVLVGLAMAGVGAAPALAVAAACILALGLRLKRR